MTTSERLDGRAWFARTAGALARDLAVAPVIAARDRLRPVGAPPVPPPGAVRTLTTPDGARLAVRVTGSTTRTAPTFLLTHGLCCDHGVWVHQVCELARRGRVVTWDLRGHGASVLAPGSDPARQLRPDVLARDLGAVVAAVDDDAAGRGPLVLAGHSLGGVVVLLALRDLPVVRARTAAAALLATPAGDVVHSVTGGGGITGPEAAAVRALLHWLIGDPLAHYGALHARGAAWVGYAAVRAGGFGADPDPAQVRAFRDAIVRTPPRVRRATLRAMAAIDLRGTLGHVDVPALVVVGGRDRLVNPRLSRALAAELPAAEFLELPSAGHALVLERHAVVSAHLAALAPTAPGGAAAGGRTR